MNRGELKRNFSIIAHIDHGKSTLSDRLLEETGVITQREMKEQFLDKLELERERGITIKAQAVSVPFKSIDGNTYTLNFIDTPGHVDFSYEVSRALTSCEGALLVVDASQGVEAQTIANVYLAVDNNLEIVPVINKIDLPAASPERVKEEIEEIIGLDASYAVLTSAKTGVGIRDLLEAIVKYIPSPNYSPEKPLKALIFDSWFDSYRGVIILIRLFEGRISKGEKVHFIHKNATYEVQEVGVFSPFMKDKPFLESGDVGYLIAGIKQIQDVFVGDTVTTLEHKTIEPLKGFKKPSQMVYSGVYPVDSNDYEELKISLEKLSLNDASFTYEPETSEALGFGFRCGFLGLLHMEVIQERLEREYNLDLITTVPNVIYKVYMKKGEMIEIDNPSKLPPVQNIDRIEEPYVVAKIHTPDEYVGAVIKAAIDRRGVQKSMDYLSRNRVVITFLMPLGEIIFDFFDKIKSLTRGYASFEYEMDAYMPSDLVKLDVLINGDLVDALSLITHRDKAYYRGRDLTIKMKDVIPRQMFEVAIQAAIGTRVISRTTVKAYSKNVTAKCYGGDISRKRKLLEKQKEGKKRMKQLGNVEIPQEAFLAVLKIDSDN
ncbi:elongation factor 4 [bacterium]|nr:elongation factor 4 [bacterium]